jgi:hypothetical protein
MVSPYTIDDLAALLDDYGMRYTRHEGHPVLSAYWGCDLVPHTLRFVVDPERGYLSVFQHNLAAVSSDLVPQERLGEACRFALMINGDVLFGGFMLYGSGATDLSFGAVVPTDGAMLSGEQVRDVISCICVEVDFVYPLLQAVLWGGMSATDAYDRFRGCWGDGGETVEADGPEGDLPPAAPEDGGRESGPRSVSDTDEIDDAFLSSYDRNDQFSAVAAEAIRRLREQDAQAGQQSQPPKPRPGD